MTKSIHFGMTIHDICKKDPEVIGIMQELGFENITNPAMLNSVGRLMTIPKGAAMKGLDLSKIKEHFVQKGYTIQEEEVLK